MTPSQGGAGADILIGGAGNDTFIYTNLKDSLVANFDTIADFNAGVDKIKLSNALATNGYQTLSVQTSGNLSTDLTSALTASKFLAASAALVNVSDAYGSSNYLVINDGVAGFQAANDSVIKMATITGSISRSSFVA